MAPRFLWAIKALAQIAQCAWQPHTRPPRALPPRTESAQLVLRGLPVQEVLPLAPVLQALLFRWAVKVLAQIAQCAWQEAIRLHPVPRPKTEFVRLALLATRAQEERPSRLV